jgi:uncharacterized protein (DUF58 family)
MIAPTSDHRVYAEFETLLNLRLHAEGFSFLPRQAIHSILSGRHASRLRGRGLSFEELRAYRVGDDIRTLDWKVSNRTRKPHVRVYSEERERDVLLLIDQRSHMFFGSQVNMKSVTAAELAGLAVWRVLAVKDRVGALVFNDRVIKKVRPQRSRKAAMQILHHTVDLNHQLNCNNANQNSSQLNTVLREAERLCRHDSLVVLISDMDGWDQQTVRHLGLIKMHNDVLVSLVYDKLERDLPEFSDLIVSDGELQVSVNAKTTDLAVKFSEHADKTLHSLQGELEHHAIPLLQVSTNAPVHLQLREALGRKVGQDIMAD